VQRPDALAGLSARTRDTFGLAVSVASAAGESAIAAAADQHSHAKGTAKWEHSSKVEEWPFMVNVV
jgi:hypothetical protein